MTAALPAGGDKPRVRTPPPPLENTKSDGGVGDGCERGGEGGVGVGGSGGGGRGRGGYCGEAAGAGRLGGVADPDVDALLRSSQPLRRR